MDTNIKIFIADDDAIFIEALVSHLHFLGFRDFLVANRLIEALNIVNSQSFDLAILDIDLGSSDDGIEIGRILHKVRPNTPIIYFTNFFSEAVYQKVLKIQPHAFLDKELSQLKVRQAVELAILNREAIKDNKEYPVCYLDHGCIFVKIASTLKKIELEEIIYVYYSERYSNLQVKNKAYPVNMPIRSLLERLPDHLFVQIHQTYIINIKHISQLNIASNQVEIGAKWLPIGVSFKKDFLNKLDLLT